MTGHDDFPESSPVAEYRDPELVRRFASDPVPHHGAGFWQGLEARLGTEGDEAQTERLGEVTPLLAPSADPASVPSGRDRWGVGRILAAAAATIAVLGLGGTVLVSQNRSTSPLVSAAPSGDTGSDLAGDGIETAPSSMVSTMVQPTTTTAPTSTLTAPSPAFGTAPDYFADVARIDPLGPGRVVGFSPDDGAALIVDDAPGIASGCEEAELLALFAQDLATGERRPAMGNHLIETGGLELAISPFASTPPEIGTRPVYGTDWCDGERASAWRGTLAADGLISNLESVEIGGSDDPFVERSMGASSVTGLGSLSPDGSQVLSISERGVTVTEVGAEAGSTGAIIGSLADDLAIGPFVDGIWAPSGEAVALRNSGGAVTLWDPRTGDLQRFAAGTVVGLVFDNSGSRLAVVSWDGEITSSILTFGDRPQPVPAPPRCSGRVRFSSLSADSLAGRDLPKEVVATMLAIDAAAAICDWEALERLTPDQFVASFGSGGAVTIWRGQEAGGQSPMWYLRTLLRQPYVVDETTDPTFHVWPALHLDTDCDYDDSDEKTLRALGFQPGQAEQACSESGGYLGYRTAIETSGSWRYFVAGD